MPSRVRRSADAAADPGHRTGLPDQPDQRPQALAARWSPWQTPWFHRARRGSGPPRSRRRRHIAAMRSRIEMPPYITVWLCAAAGACQYSCVWWMSQEEHDRSTFRKGLARPGPEGTGEKRLHRAEGRTAGQGDGGVARQLLLALSPISARSTPRSSRIGARSPPSRSSPTSRRPPKDENPLACCCAGCSANG